MSSTTKRQERWAPFSTAAEWVGKIVRMQVKIPVPKSTFAYIYAGSWVRVVAVRKDVFTIEWNGERVKVTRQQIEPVALRLDRVEDSLQDLKALVQVLGYPVLTPSPREREVIKQAYSDLTMLVGLARQLRERAVTDRGLRSQTDDKELIEETIEFDRLFTSVPKRGSTVHARHPASFQPLCKSANTTRGNDRFDPTSKRACKQCLAVIEQRNV